MYIETQTHYVCELGHNLVKVRDQEESLSFRYVCPYCDRDILEGEKDDAEPRRPAGGLRL